MTGNMYILTTKRMANVMLPLTNVQACFILSDLLLQKPIKSSIAKITIFLT